jgi:hypothetical protein
MYQCIDVRFGRCLFFLLGQKGLDDHPPVRIGVHGRKASSLYGQRDGFKELDVTACWRGQIPNMSSKRW